MKIKNNTRNHCPRKLVLPVLGIGYRIALGVLSQANKHQSTEDLKYTNPFFFVPGVTLFRLSHRPIMTFLLKTTFLQW